MKKRQKFSVFLAVVTLVLALFVPTQAAFANTGGNTQSTPISRLAGSNRYATAVQISQAGWADNSSPYAVLSSGTNNNLVDALTAAPLAKLKNAPILLTQGDKLNDDTKAELHRLGVTTVYVTSGIGVITKPVLDELKTMNITFIPLGGSDRFATALNIANLVGLHGKIVVASAYSNADALSIAPIAAALGMPILLSNPEKLPDNVAAYLDSVKSNVQQTYIIGGAGVITAAVQNSLPHPIRIGGTDRFDTNKLVIGAFSLDFNAEKGLVYVANGGNSHLVDALTGSILAAKNTTAIVLSSNPMPDETKELLIDMFPLQGIVALGGDTVVPKTDLEQVSIYTDYSDPGTMLGSSDQASSLKLTNNTQITGDNLTLQNTSISKSLYITGNNVSLSNVDITGGLILEQSGGGITTLNNVTAKGIVLNIGAAGTYQLNNVTAEVLVNEGKNQVKLAISGNTTIDNSIVMSDTTLDGGEGTGTFGNVLILGVPQAEGSYPHLNVQLTGDFQDPIIVSSQATVTAMPGATVNKMGIATINKGDKVILQGAINHVDVLSESLMEITNGSNINNITTYANTNITVDKTAAIGGITKVNNAAVTLVGEGAQNVGSPAQ